MALRISDDLELPDDAQTQTFAILAKRGVGKTYTASVMAEEMAERGLRFVVLDPVGVWWGLRSSNTGKRQGYPIRVLGGEHGDLQIEVTAGEVVADLVVDKNVSLIIDLSGFRKGEQRRFVTDFAERLYHRNRKPIHLFLDEADTFAPQRPMPDERRMLGAFEDLVRKGRARGIGCTLITQRASVLNKDVLTQTEVLVVLRTTGPHDRAAIESWVEAHGEPEQQDTLLKSLPSLKVGEAWLWSPGWLKGLFKKVKIRPRRTFDSSATPDVNHEPLEAKMAEIDLSDLKDAMAATIEKKKSEDPKVLKGEIARLTRELASTRPQVVVESPAPSGALKRRAATLDRREEHLKGYEKSLRREHVNITKRLEPLLARAEKVSGALGEVVNVLRGALAPLPPLLVVEEGKPPRVALPPHVGANFWPKPKPPAAPARPPRASTAAEDGSDDGKVTPARQKILDALAFLESIEILEPSKIMLALFCRKSAGSGGFRNDLGKLRTQGRISYPSEGSVSLTEKGRREADASNAPQTRAALHEHVRSLVRPARWKIVSACIDTYPTPMSREVLAQKIEKSAGSGGFRNDLGKLHSAGIIAYPSEGHVAASDVLFPPGLES